MNEVEQKKSDLFFVILLIVISIFILFIYFFINQNSFFNISNLEVKKGVLDLSGYELNNLGLVTLNGEWEFYYNKLYTPEDFREKKIISPVYVNVPDYWTSYDNVKPKPTIKGIATYRVKIKLNKFYSLGLYINGVGSAYKLYINGNKYFEKGKVDPDFNKARFRFSSNVIFFQPVNNEVEIVIQVQNKDYFKTGIYQPIKFGVQKKIYNFNYFSLAADLFIFGIIFIMAVYNFLMYLINNKEMYYFFFSLFIISIGYKTLSSNQLFLNALFPNLYLKTDIKIYDFFLFLILPLFSHYLYYLFPLDYNTKIFKIVGFISIPIIISIPILSIHQLNYVLYFYEGVAVLYIIYLGYFIVLINIKKRTLANFLGYGIALLIISTILDVLTDMNILHMNTLFPAALTIFIFIQTVALSYRFMFLYNQVNYLQKQIEKFDSQKVFTNIGKNYSILIHNIKNKINVVSGYKELLLIFLHELEKNPGKINIEKLENILKIQDKNINELSNTLTNLSYYVKTQTGKVEEIDINKLLAGVFLSYKINSEIIHKFEIKTEFSDKRIIIKADAMQFSQIFENLISNSIDACFEKNKNIEHKTRINKTESNKNDDAVLSKEKYLKQPNIITCKTYVKSNYCFIEFTDNCGGIPFCYDCKKLNCLDCNVFQIGKTTKVEGSGQGMVFVLNKVKEFKGDLKIISKKYSGTTFIFSFPILEEV